MAAYSGKDDEIDMKTRSMLQIMLEFAATCRCPSRMSRRAKPRPGRSAQAAGPRAVRR